MDLAKCAYLSVVCIENALYSYIPLCDFNRLLDLGFRIINSFSDVI